MTDAEIIKALKKYSMDLCSNCEVEKTTLCNNCISEIERNALDLINRQKEELESIRLSLGLINKRKYYRKFVDEVFRKQKGKELSTPDFDYIYELYFKQQAEIERLEEDSKRLKKVQMQLDDLCIMHRTIRAEAIKEFAERLKERARPTAEFCEVVLGADIDNLVKEMVGDTE